MADETPIPTTEAPPETAPSTPVVNDEGVDPSDPTTPDTATAAPDPVSPTATPEVCDIMVFYDDDGEGGTLKRTCLVSEVYDDGGVSLLAVDSRGFHPLPGPFYMGTDAGQFSLPTDAATVAPAPAPADSES